MSTLIVNVCVVDDVRPHPNADRVELIHVKGWTCVSAIGQFQKGEKCVYFPPDSVIPEEVAEHFGIAKYCSPLAKGSDGVRPPGLRIRAQRFRGEPSFGTVQKLDDPSWPVGMSLLDHYRVTKYEPPMRTMDGDAAKPNSLFHAYTDIENVRNFPDLLEEGEEVVIMEKIHGSNLRLGLIFTAEDSPDGSAVHQFMAGSHGVRRKEFDQAGKRSKFWLGLTDPVKELLKDVAGDDKNVIIYGEIYGEGIQDLTYGVKGLACRFFDISVNGKYLSWTEQAEVFARHPEVETAPILYRGPFSMEKVKELTDGNTTLCDPDKAGSFKGREGVVVRPTTERYSEKLPNYGRVILKSISVDYLGRKGGTEYH